MLYRKPYDELDNCIAKLDAFTRLISHLQDIEPTDRDALRESEGRVVEQMLHEVRKARRAFDLCWSVIATANDRKVS